MGSLPPGPPSPSTCITEGVANVHTLRFGCLNARGIKSNMDYATRLMCDLDIFAISEHWLHSYDLHLLGNAHADFNFMTSTPSSMEDTLTCTPRFVRGSGGVALMWRKTLTPLIKKLPDLKLTNERCVTIQVQSVPRPLCIVSAYLPCHSGCTDTFKEALDYVDAIFSQLSFDNDLIILDDLNADPGPSGGPLASTPMNKQGRILLQYLNRWNYKSVHLHSSSSPFSHTYTSEAHNSLAQSTLSVCLSTY